GSINVVKATTKPFAWNQDSVWHKLENDFRKAQHLKPAQRDSTFRSLKIIADLNLAAIQGKQLSVTDSNVGVVEHIFFSLAPLIAVKAGELYWYSNYYNEVRNCIKLQSQHWDVQQVAARNLLYRLLYGMRIALEEALLQHTDIRFPPAMLVKHEPSVTPKAEIFGIEVHSGDLLVSRGGAEVSALISRGNDYPGNFSHVALLYVEEKTNKAFLIEAHIEKGVTISSLEQYEKDKKLRFMVMRPRADLPVMIADPMLPQRAAKKMYQQALSRHIPYDFKMNYQDSTALFCSEVASLAYRQNGLQLWPSLSTISSQGVVNWLQDFGVENFVTQMPSDLEYDPQLAVVAEWRDPGTLFKDHIDNAVMDALLAGADNGEEIGYNPWALPVVRIIKAYCMIQNSFGKTGVIPEGMSATSALKNEYFVAMYNRIKLNTEQMVHEFIKWYGYRPPYWKLVEFARKAATKK
ncbi:MAG: hypothetical protein H7258_08865, partial [Ferruginibacter sp.]|nr:hypothetical protein [Ferruginibacter sp.]